jgi:hypothetical protein
MLDYENNSDVIEKLVNISEKIEEELEKDTIDEEKLFKLRYEQLIKGLYLNQYNKNY